MDSNFLVAHFHADESVEAVPSFWFEGKKLCAWPKNKALVGKFIVTKHIPNDKEFRYLSARILYNNIENLEKARKIADIAKYKSDFSVTDDETVKEVQKPSSPSSSTSSMPLFDCSDIENFDEYSTSLKKNKIRCDSNKKNTGWSPSPKKMKVKTQQHSVIGQSLSAKQQLTFNEELNDRFLDIPLKQTTYSSQKRSNELQNSASMSSKQMELNKDTECLHQILRNLTFLKYELKQVLSNQVIIMQRLETTENILEQNPVRFDRQQKSIDLSNCPLPINNIIDLTTLENKISGDQDFKNQLVAELSYIGGKNVKLVVKRIMSKLFCDNLLSSYSYTGKKGKDKFSTLSVCSVVFDAVKKQTKFKNVQLNEIEEVIKYILAQAPFNFKRLEAKQNKTI